MKIYLVFLLTTIILVSSNIKTFGQDNYLVYNKEIISCEQLIAENKFSQAIEHYETLFKKYDFIFLRDIKVATQLCAYEKDFEAGFKFIRLGIANGWTLKNISKDNKLKLFHKSPAWKNIEQEYDSLHNQYLLRLNMELKEQVHVMFKKDQKKAFGAFVKIGQKAKRRYSEKKFAPHSEKQMEKLNNILDRFGYPGEKLIGNDLWGSVILSHHNSISVKYNLNDTLYSNLKPKLIDALKKGEISTYEFAVIADWRIAALNHHSLTSFGFLGSIPHSAYLKAVNKNRAEIGMRSIELQNKLIGIENDKGLNLYLPKGWQNGKITVEN
ncbi:hypothetical protein [Chondrinema litorale]|uniref:hypothetical protein n=1 Tax=Chondrinema litorale TaxID=2994555 RepID=UPI0025437C5E|nr:hypothetical protein [Chondrinema litorale]UZR97802.1 hypothetical protein OQ292_27730 [Chondrinema litorale]